MRRLVHRRVGMLGAVDAEPRQIGAAGQPLRAHLGHRRLARRRERVHRRDRRRVVDDARTRRAGRASGAASRARPLRARSPRATSATTSPSRRAPPTSNSARMPGRADEDREVAEEAGMIPVRDAGHDHRTRSRRRSRRTVRPARARRRQRRRDVARLRRRENRIALGVLEVVGDPVDETVGLRAKVFHLEIWKCGDLEIYPDFQIPRFPNLQIIRVVRP